MAAHYTVFVCIVNHCLNSAEHFFLIIIIAVLFVKEEAENSDIFSLKDFCNFNRILKCFKMRFKIVLDIDFSVSRANRGNLHALIVNYFFDLFGLINSHIVDVKLLAETAKLHFGNAVLLACCNLTFYRTFTGFVAESGKNKMCH